MIGKLWCKALLVEAEDQERNALNLQLLVSRLSDAQWLKSSVREGVRFCVRVELTSKVYCVLKVVRLSSLGPVSMSGVRLLRHYIRVSWMNYRQGGPVFVGAGRPHVNVGQR